MLIDTRSTFANALAVDAAAGRALVGDVMDIGTDGAFLSNRHGELVIQIRTAFTSGGAATVQFCLASDAQAAIAVDGTETRHFESRIYTMAQAIAGVTLIIPPPQGLVYERYLGIQVVTAAATTTAGAIDAFMTLDADTWRAYPEAIS